MTRSFPELAKAFVDADVLAPSDVHAVTLAAARFGETDPVRLIGLAFAVRAPRVGHTGVDLARIAKQVEDEYLLPTIEMGEGAPELPWPDPSTWASATLSSPMVGTPEQRDRPFVRQALPTGDLLLTRRMYREQKLVAEALRARAKLAVPAHAAVADLEATIAALFPGAVDSEAARAVRLAASRRLAIVIGGPGTGKTFSITRLLAALLATARKGRPLVIRLAAPTGKAAVRMREAIREATDANATPALNAPDAVRAQLRALEASTVHRLLGMRPDGSSRHGRNNPLPADVVVVDEVSMLDLTLMRRLLDAMDAEARLVLLGDRDQLASVEAGCVLADLVGDGTSGALAGNVQILSRSHRFESAPEIAQTAACLRSYAIVAEGVPTEPEARLARAVEILTTPTDAGRIEHLGVAEAIDERDSQRPTDAQLEALARPYVSGFALLDEKGTPSLRAGGYVELLVDQLRANGKFSSDAHDPKFHRAVLDALDAYRVLAVHRRGPLGVAGLEAAIAKRVRERLARDESSRGKRHWIGRPILITENAYDVALMNGDVGIVLPGLRGPVAVFPHERRDEVRVVALSRLPPHQGALAMTVHKAQGSQFERIALVLAGRASPIQTRELVYTGVTRAKNQLAWLGGHAELRDALDRRIERASGLQALLVGSA